MSTRPPSSHPKCLHDWRVISATAWPTVSLGLISTCCRFGLHWCGRRYPSPIDANPMIRVCAPVATINSRPPRNRSMRVLCVRFPQRLQTHPDSWLCWTQYQKMVLKNGNDCKASTFQWIMATAPCTRSRRSSGDTYKQCPWDAPVPSGGSI